MPLSSRYYDVGTDFNHLALRYSFVVAALLSCCLFAVMSLLCPTSNFGYIITVRLPSAPVFTVLFTNE